MVQIFWLQFCFLKCKQSDEIFIFLMSKTQFTFKNGGSARLQQLFKVLLRVVLIKKHEMMKFISHFRTV